ncbi:MAG: hypothetical protein AAF598_20820 [Bacteroidota bacterium]
MNEQVLSNQAFRQMATPFPTNSGKSSYGLGTFTQEFLGQQLVWGYGQEDCFSSLLLLLPGEGLSLTLLANNNLMSDPARLINGDVTYSLFAMRFLKHFLLDQDDLSSSTLPSDFQRQELLAQALASSFMSQADTVELTRSQDLTRQVLQAFQDVETYGNLSLMRLLMVLTESKPEEFGSI